MVTPTVCSTSYLVLTIYGCETEAVAKSVDPCQSCHPRDILRLIEKVGGEVEGNGGVKQSSTERERERGREREREGRECVCVCAEK